MERYAVPDLAAHADQAAAAFARTYACEPEGVWWAPAGITLLGDHLDGLGGPVLSLALPVGTAVAARSRPDRLLRVASAQHAQAWSGSLDELRPGLSAGWEAGLLGVLWALEQRGERLPGLDLLVDTPVPNESGLQSSAAMTCAVVVAACDLAGSDLAATTLVSVCVQAEHDFTAARTVGMQHTVALRAVAGHALLLEPPTRAPEPVRVPWGRDTVRRLVVVDSSSPRPRADGPDAERRERCERAAARLGVTRLVQLRPAQLPDLVGLLGEDAPLVRHVVTEAARVRAVVACVRAGQLDAVGPLLTASHASLRDDLGASRPELDLLVGSAVAAGADGARMTGDGTGACAVVLISEDRLDTVLEAVDEGFAAAGFAPPTALAASPAGPARTLRKPVARM